MNNRRNKNIAKKNALLRGSIFALFGIALVALLSTFLLGSSDAAPIGLAAGMLVVNKGRQITVIPGIQGVASAGVAQVNLPCNRRYHRLNFRVTNNAAAATVDTVVSSVKLIVNGIAIRDIAPLNLIRIAQANGYIPLKGELPIIFSQIDFLSNTLEPSDQNSWDLVGQSTFTVQITLKGGLTNPTITGWQEFDYGRNQLPNGQLFAQPIAYRENSFNLSAGKNIITTVPFNYPIRRLWFKSATAGGITELEILQDGNKVFEATYAQMKEAYRQFKYKFETADWDSRTFAAGTSDATLAENSSLEARLYFDAAFLADPDGRWWKALKCGQSLEIRPTMTNAEALTIVSEYLPGQFAS